MTANVLMLVGATVWLAGELIGVFRKGPQNDTTSDWVRWLAARNPILRVLIGTFVISLFFHFMYGTWVLP